jgi:hypothetical protein
MLVPKTPVKKNHLSASGKYKVRFSRQVFAMKTKSIPGAMEHLA